ncbi:MAG: hypothetical protein FWD72_00820 [Eggerthellaceae bacterium]|nr:hypothetical protein [Eggerthellaceae bacterium]
MKVSGEGTHDWRQYSRAELCVTKVSIPRFCQFLPENASRGVMKWCKNENTIFTCPFDLHLLKQGLIHLEFSLQNITTFDAFSGKNWRNRGMG